MSEDHGDIVQPNQRPIFLGVTPGVTVVVFEREAGVCIIDPESISPTYFPGQYPMQLLKYSRFY